MGNILENTEGTGNDTHLFPWRIEYLTDFQEWTRIQYAMGFANLEDALSFCAAAQRMQWFTKPNHRIHNEVTDEVVMWEGFCV